MNFANKFCSFAKNPQPKFVCLKKVVPLPRVSIVSNCIGSNDVFTKTAHKKCRHNESAAKI